ncbi:hypothetical protein T11_13301 [Trichinella zimbabwensis]|uniref:Uncharacterized protein n=1 Tax=Trichinella zimbabwensis TaxID=268475 RepID=A0A0V1GE38_9BILA|nr:hypothetical protein T11_13301 [Trichinella zimbabwensis]
MERRPSVFWLQIEEAFRSSSNGRKISIDQKKED